MTYLGFLVLFLVPVVAGLGLIAGRRPLVGTDMPFGRAMLLICGIAFLYTTPWDNYLVWSGVWTYGEDRVLGTLFWVPIEEYLFFVLQPVMTALWVRWLLVRTHADSASDGRVPGWSLPAAATATGLGLWVAGLPETTYLMLILVWAGPVLLGLSLYARATLNRFRRTLAVGITLPTLYLWVADTLAIRNGIWTIEGPTSLGIEPLGLPVEEAVFFLVTNALVVTGLLTFLYGPRWSESATEAFKEEN